MKKGSKQRKEHKVTTMKLIVGWLIFNSTIWVYLSYVLAFMGKEDIAETLSRYIVTDILGVTITYGVKSMVEKIFEYNEIKGITKKQANIEKEDFITRDL